MEGGVAHAKRLQDARAQKHVERLPREQLAEVTDDVRCVVIRELRAGVADQRHPREGSRAFRQRPRRRYARDARTPIQLAHHR